MKDFMGAYGTKTIGNHTSICEGSKWVAPGEPVGWHVRQLGLRQHRLRGHLRQQPVRDPHQPHPHRPAPDPAMVDRGVPLYTFDVRLSNTAAKSTEWVPIKPGMDGLVMLAMCNVIMNEGLYRKDHFKFMRVTADHHASVDEKIAAVKANVAKFTPEFAEKESGVPAAKIKADRPRLRQGQLGLPGQLPRHLHALSRRRSGAGDDAALRHHQQPGHQGRSDHGGGRRVEGPLNAEQAEGPGLCTSRTAFPGRRPIRRTMSVNRSCR